MSSNIIASIQPAKERLVNLLLEINSIELKSPEPDATIEQQEILYTMRNRTLEDKLQEFNCYTRTITSTKKKEEEEKAFEVITMGETGIYQILQQGNEATITLIMHKEDVEQKQWRQFWSSFNAAVHSQPIPEIQKLNYLYSCLNGNALEVVLGYDIAPENYEIVRRLLREKYGDPSAATTILYKELRSIKTDEKEWVKMVEHIEKVIRQLEALGENMEHSSIEHWIEDKLPEWILDKVFEQKELDTTWSVSKLRNFLLKRVNRSEKDSHTGEGCKVKKRCFYCKGSHNSALCDKKWLPSPTNTAYSGKKEQEIKEHSKTKECSTSTLTTRTSATTETLLLCREITVLNPLQPQRQRNALALFDIGSQLSFITKKLSHQLRLSESDQQIMKISHLERKTPTNVSLHSRN
uniref:DUF1758 domain-containing protein n=1 Tax=Loa loa TaxID=7209 RepID=A0A1I7V6C4_LOALO